MWSTTMWSTTSSNQEGIEGNESSSWAPPHYSNPFLKAHRPCTVDGGMDDAARRAH
jgi:hypothetical protein